MAGKIQNEDIKSAAELVSAGATAASMPNDDKIWVKANTINKSLNQAIVDGDIGGGSGGGKNYLSKYNSNTGNGNFELNATTGWSLFNTTLTSGIPTGTITAGAASVTTFNIVSSGQLALRYSLQTASSAAWAAGAGFISDAFTIDIEDQAEPMAFKFSFKAVSGATNINFSGTSANTFAVYIYDTTNSAWIQPTGVYGIQQSSGVGICTGTFQSTSNSTQYRVAVLAVNASAGAVTMYWDSFTIGPQTTAIGVPAVDAKSYTPTFVGFGTVASINFYQWRVGDRLYVSGSYTTGTNTAVVAKISLPTGMTIDTAKSPSLAVIGSWAQTGTGDTGNILADTGTTATDIYFSATYTSTGNLTHQNGTALASNAASSVLFSVPILGWSANVQFSNDTDTRLVAAELGLTSNYATGGADAVIKYDTVVKDTHTAYASGTGLYTVPITGQYKVTVVGLVTSGSSHVYVKQNGVNKNWLLTANSTTFVGGGASLDCKAGDTIGIYAVTSSTFNGQSTGYQNHVTIERLSGPATIAASEPINAIYTTAAGQSITNSTDTTVVWGTKIKDSHGAMNTSTGVFTCPAPGVYDISVINTFTSNATGVRYVSLTQSGSRSDTYRGPILFGNAGGAGGIGNNMSFLCIAGDTLVAQIFQSSGGSLSLSSTATQNVISIRRSGS